MATLKRPRSSESWEHHYNSSCYGTNFFHERKGHNSPVSMNPYTMRNYWVPAEPSDNRQWAPMEASDYRRFAPTVLAVAVKDILPVELNPWQRVSTGASDFRRSIPTAASDFLPVELNSKKSTATPSVGLKMVAGSAYLPKDNPEKPEGDDAHFVSLEAQTIGVADGVGGWCKQGIDAGKYARDLMKNSRVAAESEPNGAVNPKRVMQEAYSNTKAPGSSTACIITLSGNALRAANVGDSGFIVVRDGKVVYQSPVQQHHFNCPYQLGNSKDDPSLAQELQIEVQKGDIVVAGTDGVFDNLHGFEIEEVIKSSSNKGDKPDYMACTIANLALYNSFDRYAADTPFARKSREAGHSHHKGGKVDDITVIVAWIQ
ncbi:probable protein phosphatase 2C 80 isoform X1 [Coffea arabica]|uniref:Protein phosphatase n=1 Tax=Coffea arabica TaxID=13443 RepID=A0ABM4WXH7_COFAR